MQIIQIHGCGVADAFCGPPAINSDPVKGMLLGKWVSISKCVLRKIYMICTFLYFCNANNREVLHFLTSSERYYLDFHVLPI